MNQAYDEPMDRVSVSIQKWFHAGIKELGLKTKQKKGTLMRKLMYMGYTQLLDETNDGIRSDSATTQRDSNIEGQPA